MIRRPLWLGAGVVIGVGGTLWVEQRVRRRVRSAIDLLSPAVAGNETLQAARDLGDRVRGAWHSARAEQRRHEATLWARMGEIPRPHHPADTHRRSTARGTRRTRRRHR